MPMSELFDIAGKVALLTGGARGLGRMIAEALVRADCKVYITSRDQAACEQAALDMCAYGTCVALTADLATAESAVSLANSFKSQEGRLDILVNNAGRSWGGHRSSPSRIKRGIS